MAAKKAETNETQNATPTMPLSIILENAKGKMTDAVNQVLQETQLPPSLAEGILDGILSDIRRQKNLELVSDMNRMQEQEAQQKEEE